MSWVTVIWSMVASACLTLAGMHLLVWVRNRAAWASLFFSLTAAATAAFAAGELWMMRAQTPEQFATAVRWLHVPAWAIILSLVGFVRLYLRAGRPWLGWTICALRTFSLLLNFLFGQNLNYREVTQLRQTPFFGESVTIAEGVSNPWMLIGQLSLLLLVVFVADAAIVAWRRGDRRQALVTGGSIVLWVLAGMVQAVLVVLGIFPWPFSASLLFMAIVAAMGFEMSRDLLRAAQLSDDLRESEERMTLAAEAAGLGLWVWSIGSNRVWASEKWFRLLGFAPDAILSFENVIQRIHRDDRESVEREVRRAVEARGDYAGEYRVDLPDGTQRWIAARGRVHPNTHGKPARMVGVSVDISERKRSEEALRESEARFRAIANAAPVLIWMSGPDKLCNFFNKVWIDFTGRTLEQEMGNGWTEGVHPDDLEGCLKKYVESFDARRPFTIEYRLRRHDGEYRWISDNGVPRYDSERSFLGYIGSCVDLTERKLAEEEFRLVVEAAPNGIVLINDQGRITMINAQTERLFGYTREELVGQTVDLLVPERLRGAHPGHRARFIASPEARAMGAGRELFGRRKDGTEFPVEIGLSPIQGSKGILVLTTIVDITARTEAEAEAVRQRNVLAHVTRVSTMSQLASSLAHELNQPLGAILRNAEAGDMLLQDPSPDIEEVRAILADIRKDDQRAGEVIDRMRSLMKRGEVQREFLDMSALARDVVALVRLDSEMRRVRLALETDPALPRVRGDRVQLQQVVLNLLLNAMDSLKDKPVAGRHVEVLARSAGEVVEVTVSDNGQGISADKLSRVFEPFFTSKPNGLGMGLAISRSIIEAHGGRLWAENNDAGGARFTFTLPVTEGDETR